MGNKLHRLSFSLLRPENTDNQFLFFDQESANNSKDKNVQHAIIIKFLSIFRYDISAAFKSTVAVIVNRSRYPDSNLRDVQYGTYLSLTQPAHTDPPYGLFTVFNLLDRFFNLHGRTALI